MTRYQPPPKPMPAKKIEEAPLPKDTNALWRMAEWFPKVNKEVLEKLKIYHGELLKFNQRVNLISKNTEREADELHFADCLMAADIILARKLAKRVYDIGSGNGLPGVLLGIMDSSREYILVDSDARKGEFLKHAVAVLKLKNVTVMNARVESLTTLGIEAAVSRGFASIGKAALACNKIFVPGGQFFHLKGNNWSTEIAELPSQLISVWGPELVGEYTLPVTQARRAIVNTAKK